MDVLVVDDESSIRFILRLAFESAGYDVREAADGEAALHLVAESKPDLVSTDFMMPVMNGGEFIRRLRADPETARIPVLLISSSPGAATVAGADAAFVKPFDPGAVLDRCEQLLGARG